MKTFIKPFALIAALSIPALASAEIISNQTAEAEVRITYNPADIKTSDGRVKMERQVRRAARKVCGERQPLRSGSFRQATESRECIKKAVEETLRKLNLDDQFA